MCKEETPTHSFTIQARVGYDKTQITNNTVIEEQLIDKAGYTKTLWSGCAALFNIMFYDIISYFILRQM